MTRAHAVIAAMFLLVVGVPFVLHTAGDHRRPKGVRTLVVVTPHVLQIQEEFGRAFSAWHERTYGEAVWVDFRLPGGTTEILKLLKAQYSAAAQRNFEALRRSEPARVRAGAFGAEELILPGDIAFDVMFGGGSYDHTLLCDVRETPFWYRPFAGERSQRVTISLPDAARFDWGMLERSEPLLLDLVIDGAPRRLRVPAAAVRGGWGVLSPLREEGAMQVEAEVELSVCEAMAQYTMAMPMEIREEDLAAWFARDDGTKAEKIGSGVLYRRAAGDSRAGYARVYWVGTALSGFGIVYNRDVLERLGVEPPKSFADMCDPRLAGWVALADPRMSGSVETAFESILNNEGWEQGWRILRGMSANARYVTDMSTKPPVDVAHGEAAMGVCIDFYGRAQSQAVMRPGETPETSRVGYIDPPGKVFIDPDPITLLRGGKDPELAQRFVAFVMSDEGQALWQFAATGTARGAENAVIPGVTDREGRPVRMGPRTHELRRMPVRHAFIVEHWPLLTDKVDPYAIASTQGSRGWRSGIRPMMGAFGIDNARELRRAWRAMHRAIEEGVEPEVVAEMERLLYALPEGARVRALWNALFADEETTPEGAFLDFSPEHYGTIRETWRNPRVASRLQIVYTAYFRENYARVVELAQGAGVSAR
ncbi:MAG: extracellular solute-binding protein [Phycisphaeraceae bacterium]|nr:extracellular solute-binding protein [Phycisphaeraceae bacterium]